MKNKIKGLDGIRGLMALNVVFNHFIAVFFPAMYYVGYNSTSMLQKQYSISPIAVLTNGNIAVHYFFVLSGFLTALSMFKSKQVFNFKTVLVKGVIKYKRLIKLVFIGVFFAYFLMKSGLMYHLDSVKYAINNDLIVEYNNFEPSITSALYDIFITTFVRNSQYVGPLWTMKWELIGSFVTVIIVSLLKNKKSRRLVYVFLSVALYIVSVNLSSFLFGIFVADLYYYTDKDINPTLLSKYYNNIVSSKIFLFTCLTIGIYFSTVPSNFAGIYLWLSTIPYLTETLCRSIGVALLLFVVLNSTYAQEKLSVKPLLWLGGISSYIYVLHWPLMLSLEHYLFQILMNVDVGYNRAAILAFILTFPVIILVSYMARLIFSKKRKKHIELSY